MNKKLKNLSFLNFNVDKRLNLFVQSYWQVKSILEKPTNYLIAPDGAMGLIINLGDSIKINTENKDYDLKYGEIILLGIHDHAVSMELRNNCDLLGIRFNLAGAFCFFENCYGNLYQNNIFIKEMNLFKELEKDSSNIENTFNTYLLNLFIKNSKLESFIQVLKNIEDKKGNIGIEELADILDISRRSLDRLFKKYISTSANIYLRIIKIKYTRENLRNMKFESLTQVGYDNGYFDQSHFIKEFKIFMQKSPKQYMKEKKTLS
jgi:AraC-like DNA-binding protein